MLLIPIGRDDAEIRRHAWISYAIIALNILMFVAVETSERASRMTAIDQQWREAIVYVLQRPYLETPPEMAEVLREDIRAHLQQNRASAEKPPAEIMEREQAALDALAEKAVESYRGLPRVALGYVPAEGGFLRLLTSMFIHSGLLHLLGNLLFFYLSGPFIEDVFGRPLFGALYVTGGIVAALTFAGRHPDTTVPLVGASGAIAAVMGAYLVRFLKSKVEFLFIPFLLRPLWSFRFFLPAFVVLPLWFVQQMLELSTESAGGTVAVSAHMGGFAYGFIVALVVKFTRFEEKYVNPAVEKETTWTMDERLARALDARNVENYDGAKAELASLLRDEPGNIDALRTAVEVAQASEDAKMLDNCATRLLTRYVEEKMQDLALDLVREITADRFAPPLPKFLARAASLVERSGDREWALGLYERMFDADPNGPAAVGSLVKIGTLLRLKGDAGAARDTFAKARAHPACTAEWAPTIDAKIAQCETR